MNIDSKKLTGNASAKELKEVTGLLSSDPVLAENVKRIEAFFMSQTERSKMKK